MLLRDLVPIVPPRMMAIVRGNKLGHKTTKVTKRKNGNDKSHAGRGVLPKMIAKSASAGKAKCTAGQDKNTKTFTRTKIKYYYKF